MLQDNIIGSFYMPERANIIFIANNNTSYGTPVADILHKSNIFVNGHNRFEIRNWTASDYAALLYAQYISLAPNSNVSIYTNDTSNVNRITQWQSYVQGNAYFCTQMFPSIVTIALLGPDANAPLVDCGPMPTSQSSSDVSLSEPMEPMEPKPVVSNAAGSIHSVTSVCMMLTCMFIMYNV